METLKPRASDRLAVYLHQHCTCPTCVPYFVNARPTHEIECESEHLDFFLFESAHYTDPDTWKAMSLHDALAFDGFHDRDSDNGTLDYMHQAGTIIDNPGLEYGEEAQI